MIAHLEMLSSVEHDSTIGETSDPFVWPHLGAIEHAIRELEYDANHLPEGDKGEMTLRKYWFALLYQQAAYEFYAYVVRALRQCGINRSPDEAIEMPNDVQNLIDHREDIAEAQADDAEEGHSEAADSAN